MCVCVCSGLTGLIVVPLHHSKVHGGGRGLRCRSLALGRVALGPVGADAHLLHGGELRGAAGDVDGAGEA